VINEFKNKAGQSNNTKTEFPSDLRNQEKLNKKVERKKDHHIGDSDAKNINPILDKYINFKFNQKGITPKLKANTAMERRNIFLNKKMPKLTKSKKQNQRTKI
jgi:hypothetical protein